MVPHSYGRAIPTPRNAYWESLSWLRSAAVFWMISRSKLRPTLLHTHEVIGSRLSGLSTLIKDHLAGGASRLAALLLPQILPVFLVVTPCQPGAALRDLVLVQRGQATSPPLGRQKARSV